MHGQLTRTATSANAPHRTDSGSPGHAEVRRPDISSDAGGTCARRLERPVEQAAAQAADAVSRQHEGTAGASPAHPTVASEKLPPARLPKTGWDLHQGRHRYRAMLPDGTRGSFTGKSKGDCYAKFRERFQEIARLQEAQQRSAAGRATRGAVVPARPDSSELTVRELMSRYRVDLVAKRIRASTLAATVTWAETYAAHAFGDLPVVELDKVRLDQHFREVQSGLLVPNRNGILLPRHLAPKSVRNLHNYYSGLLRYATDCGYVRSNQAAVATIPRLPEAEDDGVLNVLAPDEIIEVLTKVKDHRWELLFWIFLVLGFRKGEAIALNKRHVDLETGFVRVALTVARYSGLGLLVGVPKTKASRRKLGLTEDLLAVFRRHYERLDVLARAWGDRWVDEGWLFPTETPSAGKRPGQLVEPRWAQTVVQRTLEDLGYGERKLRVHDLRHSAITDWFYSDLKPLDVMTRAGHKSLDVTLRIYHHYIPAEEMRIARELFKVRTRRSKNIESERSQDLDSDESEELE